MNRYMLFSIMIFSALSFAANNPALLNYQGQLNNIGGSPLDTTVAMTFAIYDMAGGGTLLWSETQASITSTDGLFSVLLGSVNAIPDSAFAQANTWLGVTVGTDSEMSPRERIASVGYAYRVGTVNGSSGGNITGKLNIGNGNSNPGASAFVAGNINSARGDYSVIAGGGGSTAADSNSALGSNAVISGGKRNYANGPFSTIGGGWINQASGGSATLGGGYFNSATGDYSSVGGGSLNQTLANYSTVGGGNGNLASQIGATVAGGRNNRARGDYSNVAGGGGATEIDSNSALGDYSSIVGGARNYTSTPTHLN